MALVAYQNYLAGRGALEAAKDNAGYLRQEGRDIRKAGRHQALLIKSRGRETSQQQVSGAAAGNVSVSSASVASVRESSRRHFEADAAMTLENARRQARGKDRQARIVEKEGRMRYRQAMFRAVVEEIQMASSVYRSGRDFGWFKGKGGGDGLDGLIPDPSQNATGSGFPATS